MDTKVKCYRCALIYFLLMKNLKYNIILVIGDFMQKFFLSYHYRVDDPFYPEYESWYDIENGIYEGKSISFYTKAENLLSYVKDIRKFIKKDMEGILTCRIRDLNNSDCLVKELNTLIETIDNTVEYDFHHGHNFFFLTDNYLCFNNFENFVDELELGELGADAKTYETIVIVDRSYNNYYFIRTTKKVLAVEESTTINAYSIKDNNVKKSIVKLKKKLDLQEYTDDGLKKVLKYIKNSR